MSGVVGVSPEAEFDWWLKLVGNPFDKKAKPVGGSSAASTTKQGASTSREKEKAAPRAQITKEEAIEQLTLANWPEMTSKFSNPQELYTQILSFLKTKHKGHIEVFSSDGFSSRSVEDIGLALRDVDVVRDPTAGVHSSHGWSVTWCAKASQAIKDLNAAIVLRDKIKKYVQGQFSGEKELRFIAEMNLDLDTMEFISHDNLKAFFAYVEKRPRFNNHLELDRFKVNMILSRAETLENYASAFKKIRDKALSMVNLYRMGVLPRLLLWIEQQKEVPQMKDISAITAQSFDLIIHEKFIETMKNPSGIAFAFKQGMTEEFPAYVCLQFNPDFVRRFKSHPFKDAMIAYERTLQQDEETHQIALQVVKIFAGAYSFATVLECLQEIILVQQREYPYTDLSDICQSSVASDDYPLNAALLFSDFLKQVGNKLVNEQYFEGQRDLTTLAVNLVESVPSDPAALLYIMQRPHDNEDGRSAKFVALKTNNADFFAAPRVARIVNQLFTNVFVFGASNESQLYSLPLPQSIPQSLLFKSLLQLATSCFLWRRFFGAGKEEQHLAWRCYNSPVFRFTMRVFGYILFLAVLMSFLLSRAGHFYVDSAFTPLEVLIYLLSISFLVEEFQQAFSINHSLSDYLASGWNVIDLIIGFGFLFTFAFRIIGITVGYNDDLQLGMMIMLTLTAVAVPCRMLSVFRLSKSLGPFIKMLGKMFFDIFQFLILAGLIVFGFALSFNFLLDPSNVSKSASEGQGRIENFVGMSNTFMTLFLSFLGTFNFELFSSIETTGYRLFSIIFFAFFLGVSLIILFNILIAMMSTTYSKVQDDVQKQFLLEKAQMVWELYNSDGLLPPPFTFIVSILSLVRRLLFWVYKAILRRNAEDLTQDEGSLLYNPAEDVHRVMWYCSSCFRRNDILENLALYRYLENNTPLTKDKMTLLFPNNIAQCTHCNFIKRKTMNLALGKFSFDIASTFIGILFLPIVVVLLIDSFLSRFQAYSKFRAQAANAAQSRKISSLSWIGEKAWDHVTPMSQHSSTFDLVSPSPTIDTFVDIEKDEKELHASSAVEGSKQGSAKLGQGHGAEEFINPFLRKIMNQAETNSTLRKQKANRKKIVLTYIPDEEVKLSEIVTLSSNVDNRLMSIRSLLELTLDKSDDTGPPWKNVFEFPKGEDYVQYMIRHLKPGMKVMCVQKYESVQLGEIGEYVQHNDNFPPCQARWKIYDNTYWLYWKDIVIVEGEEDRKDEILRKIDERRELMPVWKTLSDFKDDEAAYTDYLQATLVWGMKIKAVNDSDSVRCGDIGEFQGFNDTGTPVKAWWSGAGMNSVYFRDVQIIEGLQDAWRRDIGKITGPPWKSLDDFAGDEIHYANYMKAALEGHAGIMIRCVKSYESCMEGDVGEFVQWNDGTPPCQVNWKGLGTTYWLHWRDLKIVEGTSEAEYTVPDVEAGPPWKLPDDFKTENDYATYLKQSLVPGMRIRAIREYENVKEGDVGEFVQYNQGWPPCQGNWEGYGSTYWLYWRDIEIVEGLVDDWKELVGTIVGPPWKSIQDFSKKREFMNYMKAALEGKQGIRLKMLQSYESVMEGDIGTFEQWNTGSPPLQIKWIGLGTTYWVPWENVQIVEHTSEAVYPIISFSPGPPWLSRKDFSCCNDYATYMKGLLKPGVKVLAINTYENVKIGDVGTYVQHNQAWPPCQILWHNYGSTYWMFWKDIVIVDGLSTEEIASLWMKKNGQWRTLLDFESEDQYAGYMKIILKPGMMLKAINRHEAVAEGDIGSFAQWNENTPPCQVQWKGLGTTYWLYWKDLQIVDGTPDAEYVEPIAERGPPWKKREDFATENLYSCYMKKLLIEGMKIRCRNTYENVTAGDVGDFVQFNQSWPPCQVRWEEYGNTYWLFWGDIEIVDGEVEDWRSNIGKFTSPPWKMPSDFPDKRGYSNYLKAALKTGMKIKCIQSYESVCAGDVGTHTVWNTDTPPCQADWLGLGTTHWLPWQNICIVEGTDGAQIPPVSDEVGPLWLGLRDFPNECQYSMYMKKVLKPGMKVCAVNGYEMIKCGETGEFVQFNQSWPPCQVNWSWYGNTYWLFWKDIQIVEGMSDEQIKDLWYKKNGRWKLPDDFTSDDQYGKYLKAVLVPGMKCKIIQTYECVMEGDIGEFVQCNDYQPPCQIAWNTFGSTYWLPWSYVRICEDSEDVSVVSEEYTPGPPWKKYSDFPDENAYMKYFKAVATPGIRVRCVHTYENVKEGDTGTIVQWNSNWPPCQVRWKDYGDTYWLFWRDLEITE